jgi:hypothetical protein
VRWIMKAARLVVLTKQRNEFTVQEIVLRVREDYPEFSERAIGEAIATNSRQVAPVRNGRQSSCFRKDRADRLPPGHAVWPSKAG